MSQSLIAICPKCNKKKLYEGTAKRPRITCERCHTRYYIQTNKTPKQNIINKSENRQSQVIPPTNFIDDPDELLMSVAVRELNKSNPDPRWANILISCRKENITLKSEVLEQFKQLPTKALVSLLNKNLQDEY